MKFDAKRNWFECLNEQSNLLFLSFENRVLDNKSNNQNKRKRCICRGQELAMWKDKIALETYRSAVSFGGQAAECDRRMSPERSRGTSAVSFGGHQPPIKPPNWTWQEQGYNGGFIRRFRNRRSNRRIDPRDKNQSGMNGGFIRLSRPPIITAEYFQSPLD